MSLLTSRYVLLAKTEGTYDTDPTPTVVADAVIVENLALTWPNEVIDPPTVGASLSRRKPIQGRKYGQLTFDVELKGSGTAGTAADWGPLIEACGFNEVIVGATSATYEPESGAMESVTIYAYRDGLLYKFTGCRGNVVFNFTAGQRPMMNFTMSGHCLDVIDAALASPTVDSTLPEVVVNATFTMGGYAGIISTLSVDMQNDVQMTDSVNAASGYAQAAIVARDPLGSFNPEATLVATQDWWSLWEDGTQEALSIVIGATAGNIATFTAPKCTHRSLAEVDRNKILAYEIPFTCAVNSADDEVSLAMT